jgi:hypothetical protein
MLLPLRVISTAGVLLGVALAVGAPVSAQTQPAPATGAHQTWTIDKAPKDLQPAVKRAESGIRLLTTSVQNKLMDLLATKGPLAAMDVYRREMYFLQVEVAERQGITIGQTSDRLRNGANAPRPWAAALVAASAGKRFDGVPTYVVDLGDKIGVLHPIAVGDTCAMCHGPAKFRPPDVDALLKATYPHDRANDYTSGDLRGFYWAEVSKVENTE